MLTITFDGPPTQPPGSVYSVTNYAERGTRFVGLFGRAQPPGLVGWPDNGTSYIQTTGMILPTGAPVTCDRLDGLSFRLVSVDLAGYSDVVPDVTASFEGHRADGSIVTTNFEVTGLVFQTYSFSSEFHDLTNLLVAGGALDNLTIQLPSIQPVISIWSSRNDAGFWAILRAQGTLGLRYQMEYADFLPPSNWIALTNFETSCFEIEHFPTNVPPQRFYRVMELP